MAVTGSSRLGPSGLGPSGLGPRPGPPWAEMGQKLMATTGNGLPGDTEVLASGPAGVATVLGHTDTSTVAVTWVWAGLGLGWA